MGIGLNEFLFLGSLYNNTYFDNVKINIGWLIKRILKTIAKFAKKISINFTIVA
jgi:hypothetical protein